MPESNPQNIHSAAASDGTVASAELDSLLSRVAVSPARSIRWIRVAGSDRVRWLNGMVTNSIQNLAVGAGCYNFILSAQGRIQGDAYAFAERDHNLLRTDVSQVDRLTALLDRFIIMDDVELSRGFADRTGLQVIGPGAPALLEQVGVVPNPPSPGVANLAWRSGEVTLVRLHGPLVPRFELWAEPDLLGQISDALVSTGASLAGEDSLEQLRILEGTPRFGADITDRDLPQETGQTHALHFSKGCYLGQEIVERIRSRGAVHRILTGIELRGEMPGLDQTLSFAGKKVGEFISWSDLALRPELGGELRLAIAYVRREMIDSSVELTYVGGAAVPVALPYAPAEQYASKLLREGQHA